MAIGEENDLDTVVLNKSIPAFWKIIIAIVLCQAVGAVSGLLSTTEITNWYTTLQKPSWTPPNYIFGPVWIVLYLLMGISLGLIWSAHTEFIKEKTALWIFAFQLFLNFWWSLIFFRFHAPGWAFLEITILLVAILATFSEFRRINRVAAWLLIPYFAWVCFATILNAAIWQMN